MPQDDPGQRRARLRAFCQFVLLYGAVRSWLWVKLVPFEAPLLPLSAVVFSAALGLTLTERFAHLGARVGLGAMIYQVALVFPNVANHNFLELYVLGLLSLLSAGDSLEDKTVLRALQWLTVIVLFHTGLQKVLHGYYFSGDFLSFMVAAQDRFATLFSLLLPADEIARLQSYDYLRTGQGPFRVQSPLFVAASNIVWILEMGLPFLIMWPRTRAWATIVALLLVIAIQCGALEFGFAALFINLLLLFFRQNWTRRLLPLFAMLFALTGLLVWLGVPLFTWVNL